MEENDEIIETFIEGSEIMDDLEEIWGILKNEE